VCGIDALSCVVIEPFGIGLTEIGMNANHVATFTCQFANAMIVLVCLVNLLNVDRHQVTDQIVNLLPLRLERRLVMMVLFLSIMRHIPVEVGTQIAIQLLNEPIGIGPNAYAIFAKAKCIA